jgi:GNAT superfamily N-acetyltransferase
MRHESFRIREALPSEIAEMIRHYRGTYEDAGVKDSLTLDAIERAFQNFIPRAMADQEYHSWFAETSRPQVIGGVAVLADPWLANACIDECPRAYVLNTYVYPKYRHKGVARELMKKAITWCHSLGFFSLTLHASERAKALYEELGFKPTNEMRLEFFFVARHMPAMHSQRRRFLSSDENGDSSPKWIAFET